VRHPDACHPIGGPERAAYVCALCGQGAGMVMALLGGVQTCGDCYSAWSLEVERARQAALEAGRERGLARMLTMGRTVTLRVGYVELGVKRFPVILEQTEAQP
jgi:hypothetical protein